MEVARETTKSPQDRFVAQITLTHSGTVLRGEERSSDIKTAVNSAIDSLDRRIEHYKGTLYKKGKKRAVKHEESAEETLGSKIVKEKRFRVQRLPLDEAVSQMELLGHDFFLFINDGTEQFSLLYRRQDGDYGLIECTVE